MMKKLQVVSIAILVVFLCVALNLSEVQKLKLFDLASSSTSSVEELSSNSSSSLSDAIEFEGASDFLSLLRDAHRQILANPPPHCQRRHSNNAVKEKDMKVEVFNRAIEVDWIGRNISAVEPTWSNTNLASCNFVGLAFPPTEGTLHAASHQKTYISLFHTVNQCVGSFQWERDKPITCLGNNFGGTLGANTEKGCIEESVGGYQTMLWNKQNSNDALFQCLKHYLRTDEVLRMVNVTPYMESVVANLTKTDYIGRRGYSSRDLDWSTLSFFHWSDLALKSTGILESAGITTSEETVGSMLRLMSAVKNGNNTALTKCVEGLRPPMSRKTNNTSEEERIWKETGAYLSASTMQQSPSSLLRSFPGSLHSVLPPSPTAIYSVNALLGTVVNVDSEAYYPGCTAYWNAMLRHQDEGAPPKNAFVETDLEANRNGTIFASLKKTPHILRNEIIKTCAEDESKCPYPTYDLVIDVTQVFCGAFFHWIIESALLVQPFLFQFTTSTESHGCFYSCPCFYMTLFFDSLASHWTVSRWIVSRKHAEEFRHQGWLCIKSGGISSTVFRFGRFGEYNSH